MSDVNCLGTKSGKKKNVGTKMKKVKNVGTKSAFTPKINYTLLSIFM